VTAFYQVKCTNCLCVHTFEKESPELKELDEKGYGLPTQRFGCEYGARCFCHTGRGTKTRLVGRLLDFGDEAPF
jgi:hypothetical protein